PSPGAEGARPDGRRASIPRLLSQKQTRRVSLIPIPSGRAFAHRVGWGRDVTVRGSYPRRAKRVNTGSNLFPGKILRRRDVEENGRVHGVEAELAAVGDDDAAGPVLRGRGERVAGVLLPAAQVGRGGHRRAPELRVGAAPGAAVVVGVVAALVLDELVEGDQVLVVVPGAGRQDRLVLRVAPDLEVLRGGQPDAAVVALVEEVPRPILEPGGRRAVGAVGDGPAVLEADVEPAEALPGQAVVGDEELGAVVQALGEHVVLAAVLDDH